MVSFITSLILLILGYIIYGSIVERVFGIDEKRDTPCKTLYDGVDYMPISTWKVFLIQFLNIAGTGPIFGAILGILFGPAAFIWIVLGCIFGGAVHDYMSGMISLRADGKSLPEIMGNELGNIMRITARMAAVLLLMLVGTVFVTTPADILDGMMPDVGFLWSKWFWIIAIFSYYVLATLLPIDKLIAKVYPLFGLVLLVMAAGLAYGIFVYDGTIPEVTEAFVNHHPTSSIPLFPGICITIACGAVSGFHATQSPIMSRCLQNEKYGRRVFYGSMITEGVVALIWAAATIKFADSLNVDGNTPYEKLIVAMTNPETGTQSPSILVNNICNSWMGTLGAILAIIGVVAAPITSGDTAFRSVRLIISDMMEWKQDRIYKRIILCLPVFIISFALMFLDFSILWRYFAWTNQTFAMMTLWMATYWLHNRGKSYWIALVPAVFMTIVSVSYIFVAPEGFNMRPIIGYIAAGIATAASVAVFIIHLQQYKKK